MYTYDGLDCSLCAFLQSFLHTACCKTELAVQAAVCIAAWHPCKSWCNDTLLCSDLAQVQLICLKWE